MYYVAVYNLIVIVAIMRTSQRAGQNSGEDLGQILIFTGGLYLWQLEENIRILVWTPHGRGSFFYRE